MQIEGNGRPTRWPGFERLGRNNMDSILVSGPYGFSIFSWLGPLILAVIWTTIWKGIGMWKAARNGSKVWFIVLLVINTLGILDILYIYVFSKMESAKT